MGAPPRSEAGPEPAQLRVSPVGPIHRRRTPMADEMFVLLGWAWDIDAATRLAKAYPVRTAEVRPLAGLLSLIRIAPEHAATVDLTRPLLVVPLPNIPAPGNRL